MRITRFNIGQVMIFIGVCLALIGCTSSNPKPDIGASIQNEENRTVYKDLSSKYKQLFKQNVELKKILQQLMEEKQSEKDQSDQTIKHLSNTITLLELNLKQMNSRLNNNSVQLNQLSNNLTKPVPLPVTREETPSSIPETDSEVSGLNGEFITPDSSKAIKTMPLLPNISSIENKSAPLTVDKPSAPIKGTIEPLEDSNSVFLVKKADNVWQDPDLTPPESPIQLKVIPGAKNKYQEAFKSYSNRDFNLSIKLFGEFLKRYPSDMDADNSQYWIAQSYYQLEDFLNAEQAFRKVLRNYPHDETKKGYKTPDTILMLGRIYSSRNQPVKGRYYYQEVIKRFPDSRSAAKAKREIQSMSVF